MILFVSFMLIEVRDNMMILSVDSMFKGVEMDFCFDFLWIDNGWWFFCSGFLF